MRFAGTWDAGEVWFQVGEAEANTLTLTLTLAMTPPGDGRNRYFATRLVRVDEMRFVGVDDPHVLEVSFQAGSGGGAPVRAVFEAVGIPWEAKRR